MWASASVAHSSLCPFTCALSLHGPDSFLFFKLLNSVKVSIWANSKLMSSTSSQRMVKLSSPVFLFLYCTYV